MNNRTLVEKILRRRALEPILPGSEFFQVPVDLVLGHDATIALIADRFKKSGRHIWDPERCFFAADHFAPPSTPERADILARYLNFVEEEKVPQDLLYQGISHQLMVEDKRCRPGMVICGADSHTVMAGALGCFATGLGSTDIMAVLLTGKAILQVPESIKIEIAGRQSPWLFGKDIALEIIRRIGEGGGVDQVLELHDRADLSMDSRLTISNMSVEGGATAGIFVPDETLRRYLRSRDGIEPGEEGWFQPDDGARYSRTLRIDTEEMAPLVALPGNLSRIVPAAEAKGVKVRQVFIGSCAGGRLEDLAIAARLLKGRRVAPGVRLVVTPASQRIFRESLANGIFQVLTDAGAMITNSSCGACGGIDKGLIGAGEVCVSTSNRNFRGRMGSPDGLIYLASPYTAAAAALSGELGDPREVFDEAEMPHFHAEPWPLRSAAGGAR
ncbi:MAG TPA: aconitase/3-isopropylmalate dehydratase large subunit family protein [bacterium]|nr:aconitase/3-isopropylmalate dehydratase large subunit family protein [bacterium]